MTYIEGGRLLAIPYRGLGAGPEVNAKIIDFICANPPWFSSALTPEEIRLQVVWSMTDPSVYKWEVWNGGALAGFLLLHRVVPRVDAVFHFVFLPSKESRGATLFGAHKLLNAFLGSVFQQFNLQRISAEVPEHKPKLVSFFRGRLGFRYEGETDIDRLQKNKAVVMAQKPGVATWVAAHGSRRENAHYNPDTGAWSDLILMRLLRAEYLERASSGTDVPQATRVIAEESHVVERHTAPVPAANPA